MLHFNYSQNYLLHFLLSCVFHVDVGQNWSCVTLIYEPVHLGTQRKTTRRSSISKESKMTIYFGVQKENKKGLVDNFSGNLLHNNTKNGR